MLQVGATGINKPTNQHDYNFYVNIFNWVLNGDVINEIQKRRKIGRLTNYELGWIWKEKVVAQSKYYPRIYLEHREKTTITMVRGGR
jgi:hypothetical protein